MKKTLALLLLLARFSVGAQAETLIWNGSAGLMMMTWNSWNTNWLQGGTATKYTDEQRQLLQGQVEATWQDFKSP